MIMLLTTGEYIFGNIGTKYMFFRYFYIGILSCLPFIQTIGQLTTRDYNGKVATLYTNAYGNRDTIFVFNQMPQQKTGNLSLRISVLPESFESQDPDQDPEPTLYSFKWYKFDNTAKNFEENPFYIEDDAESTSQTDLEQGGYRVIMTYLKNGTPRDSSFVAWLYMNPGFDFRLYKDDNGEVIWNDKTCGYTDFIFDSKTVQSSFKYYNISNLPQELTFDNKITFTMKAGNDSEMVTLLLTLGDKQSLRDYDPPYEDTQYYFRAYDMFGIEKKDEIMYVTIIPYVTDITPSLPETDPTSAPVPVKFTWKPYNVTREYVWRFGDGDSTVFNLLEGSVPDTVMHTYKTPKTQGYNLTVKVTSLSRCSYTSEPVNIKVDPPSLDVPNVFTPNGDGLNEFFKPNGVSLRRFEITIYTRAGKRVYYYRGDDLRDWEGWDGRIENSGNEAAEGVYFYIIKAAGWDEPATRNPQAGPYSGVVHLYR